MEQEEKEKEKIREKQNANLIPMKKGDPARPGAGCPKGTRHWSTVFREILALPQDEVEEFIGTKLPERFRKRANQEIIALKIMAKAIEGDLGAADRIMDRMDGQAKQAHELSGGLGLTVKIVNYSEEKETQTEETPDEEAV